MSEFLWRRPHPTPPTKPQPIRTADRTGAKPMTHLATSELPQYVSPKEAASVLSVTPRTLKNYVTRGALPQYRLGDRAVRFDLADVLALLRAENPR